MGPNAEQKNETNQMSKEARTLKTLEADIKTANIKIGELTSASARLKNIKEARSLLESANEDKIQLKTAMDTLQKHAWFAE